MSGNLEENFTEEGLEAITAFDNQLLTEGKKLGHLDVNILLDFLNQYSPEIQKRIRPLLEMAYMLRDVSNNPQNDEYFDQSSYSGRDFWESLLTEETRRKVMKNKFEFPIPTADSVPNFEKRYGPIDEYPLKIDKCFERREGMIQEDGIDIERLAVWAKRVKRYQKRVQLQENIRNLYDRVTGFFHKKK